MPVSQARQKFLRNIAITAVESGIGYWSSCKKYKWSNTNSLDDMLPFPIIRIVPSEDPEDFAECDITQRTIQRGLSRIASPEWKDKLNAETRRFIITANIDNDASTIDADGADAIVQAGLFNDLVFG